MDETESPAASPEAVKKSEDDAPRIEVSEAAEDDAPRIEVSEPPGDDAPMIELSAGALDDLVVPPPPERSEHPVRPWIRIVAQLPPEPPWAPSSWRMAFLALLVAVADLGTKEWAKRALAGPDLKRSAKHFEVIRDHFDFIFAQNPGGAWSFLRSLPDGLRRPFFLFVSCAAIVFIVKVYRRLERRQWAMRWGLPLALGGAIGNLADRVRYGWVVDFMDIYTKRGADELHWPTFNVADIAIVVGVGLMALDLLSLRRNKPEGERGSSVRVGPHAAR